MEKSNIPILLTVIHICYYAYFQVVSDFIRIGMTTNKPNKTISQLRTKYKVTIRTFQKNTHHYGFAWFKTIYINENLFRKPKRMLFTFYHELYHLKHKHKRNILLHRLFFSLIPLLAFIHWLVALVVYIGAALLMEYFRQRYERNANSYAREMFELKEIKV